MVAHSKNCSRVTCFSVFLKVHPALNYINGAISEPDLLYFKKEELLENIKDQNAIDVRRITIRRKEQVPTKHLILTFNGPTLSTRIKESKQKQEII